MAYTSLLYFLSLIAFFGSFLIDTYDDELKFNLEKDAYFDNILSKFKIHVEQILEDIEL